MSQESSSKKNLILIAVAVLVLGSAAAYYFMFASGGDSASSSTPVKQAEQNLQKIEQSQTDEIKKANAPPPDFERTVKKGPVTGK